MANEYFPFIADFRGGAKNVNVRVVISTSELTDESVAHSRLESETRVWYLQPDGTEEMIPTYRTDGAAQQFMFPNNSDCKAAILTYYRHEFERKEG